MSEITLGTDAEGILVDKDGRFISAIDLIGGTKQRPFIVEGGNLQEDNVLAEFAIDPVDNEEDWIKNIAKVTNALKARIGAINLGIKFQASGRYPFSELRDERANAFGCEPDFCAYTDEMNAPPEPYLVKNLRTCGGHIHVGFDFDPEDIYARHDLIKWMDVYLGLPSVVMDRDADRRTMYGKAGAFRPKEYGVEYRTLSSFWLNNEKLQRWAFRQTKQAYYMFEGHSVSYVLGRDFPVRVANVINNNDYPGAVKLMKEAAHFKVCTA